MKQNGFKQEILLQAVKMDGSINFQTNGDINIYPCPWEDGKEVTDGSRVRYRGGIEVDADGRTRVKRYHDGKYGPKYEVLYETAHGKVQMTHPQVRPGDGYRRKSEEFVYVTSSSRRSTGWR
jgi:succinate dehydrogenase/fumarate reductase flavoprotein subunit